MKQDVILSCALTGAGDTVKKNPNVPVTPKEIAEAAKEAAKAGAAIVHIHVRDPETGKASRSLEVYREVVERIRRDGTDIILNITAGMGGDFIPDRDNPSMAGPGSDMAGPLERVAHIKELKPEICTLDCCTMNYSDSAYITLPDDLRVMAAEIRDAGVKPELEVFDLGHIWLAKQLMAEGLITSPPLFQLCMGIAFGAEATTENIVAMKNMLPRDASWAAFAIGRDQMPFVAQAMLAGGNVRVGLEDNIYLEKGVLATNGSLVKKAADLIGLMGGRLMSPAQARKELKLK